MVSKYQKYEIKQNLRISGLPEEQKAEIRQEIAVEYRKNQNEFLAQVKDLSEGKVPAEYQIKAEEIKTEQTTSQDQAQAQGQTQTQTQEEARSRGRGRGR